MNFVVKCLVTGGSATANTEETSVTKELKLANPNATVQTLRASAAVLFRINPYAFDIVYGGDDHRNIDLTNEKVTLSAAGLQSGDTLVLSSKGARRGSPESIEAPPAKQSRTEDGAMAPVDTPAQHQEAGGDDAAPLPSGSEESDLEEAEEENGDEPPLGNGAGELYGRLLEVTPNLVEMRQQFLSNPEAVMLRIQQEDPSLFQLITAHQQAFIDLVNNEELVRTLQDERDAEVEDIGSLDEEMDEEEAEAISNMFMNYIAQGGEILAGGEGEGDDPNGNRLLPPDHASGESDTQRILAFTPTAEEEAKIQDLTNLGFSYDMCKVAFYMCRRSVERAANMLFENPPQL